MKEESGDGENSSKGIVRKGPKAGASWNLEEEPRAQCGSSKGAWGRKGREEPTYGAVCTVGGNLTSWKCEGRSLVLPFSVFVLYPVSTLCLWLSPSDWESPERRSCFPSQTGSSLMTQTKSLLLPDTSLQPSGRVHSQQSFAGTRLQSRGTQARQLFVLALPGSKIRRKEEGTEHLSPTNRPPTLNCPPPAT